MHTQTHQHTRASETKQCVLYCRAFTSICYSSDGMYLLAGGQSKNVCIYSVADELLIKKFEVTQNRSFDAMDVCI